MTLQVLGINSQNSHALRHCQSRTLPYEEMGIPDKDFADPDLEHRTNDRRQVPKYSDMVSSPPRAHVHIMLSHDHVVPTYSCTRLSSRLDHVDNRPIVSAEAAHHHKASSLHNMPQCARKM